MGFLKGLYLFPVHKGHTRPFEMDTVVSFEGCFTNSTVERLLDAQIFSLKTFRGLLVPDNM